VSTASPRRTCWCCGGLAPLIWAAVWSEKGSQCFACAERCGTDPGQFTPALPFAAVPNACRARVGVLLDTVPL
jgi:hypothetical protein